MNSMAVVKNGEYRDRIDNETQHNQVFNILKTDMMEVTLYVFAKDTTAGFAPKVNEGEYEIYYVVNGDFDVANDEGSLQNISTGDFISFSNSNLFYPMLVNEPSTVIMISFNQQFDITKNLISSLNDIMNELQANDGNSLEHCTRVTKLAVEIAIESKYDFTKIRNILYAAKFHDVGKSKIPREILIKPAKLTDEEYELIKKHSLYSSEMIEPYFGSEIAKIVLQHHERLDGSGYPLGLTDKQIEPASKIIAVADSYDAMITTRPYHQGISSQKAVEELKRCDNLFDQNYVDALVRCLKRRKVI